MKFAMMEEKDFEKNDHHLAIFVPANDFWFKANCLADLSEFCYGEGD